MFYEFGAAGPDGYPLASPPYLTRVFFENRHPRCFVRWLHTGAFPTRYGTSQKFKKTYLVLQEIAASPLSTVCPRPFFTALRQLLPTLFNGQQQDPHEFLALLLEGLGAANQTMFTGQQRSVLYCSACMHRTEKVEAFMHVTVSVTPRLEASIMKFSAQETLDAPCLKCGVHGGLQKRIHLDVMPEVMIVHIQRATHGHKKNEALVRYPLTFTVSSIMYDLKSVVTHEGPTLSNGHCTAIVKRSSNVWHLVDDHVSRTIDETLVVTKQAYLLVYTARDTDTNAALRSQQVQAHDTAVETALTRHEEAEFRSSVAAVGVRIAADAQEEIAATAASATAQEAFQVALKMFTCAGRQKDLHAMDDEADLGVMARTSTPAVVLTVPDGAAVVPAVQAVELRAATRRAGAGVAAGEARADGSLAHEAASPFGLAATRGAGAGAAAGEARADGPLAHEAASPFGLAATRGAGAGVAAGEARAVSLSGGAVVTAAVVELPDHAGSGFFPARHCSPAAVLAVPTGAAVVAPGRASTPAAVQVLPGGVVTAAAVVTPPQGSPHSPARSTRAESVLSLSGGAVVTAEVLQLPEAAGSGFSPARPSRPAPVQALPRGTVVTNVVLPVCVGRTCLVLVALLIGVVLFLRESTVFPRRQTVRGQVRDLRNQMLVSTFPINDHFSTTYPRLLRIRSADAFKCPCLAVDFVDSSQCATGWSHVTSDTTSYYFSFVPGTLSSYTGDTSVFKSGPWYYGDFGMSRFCAYASDCILAGTSIITSWILPVCDVIPRSYREYGPIDYTSLDHMFKEQYRVSVVLWIETPFSRPHYGRIKNHRPSSTSTVLYKRSLLTSSHSRKKWSQKRRYTPERKHMSAASWSSESTRVRNVVYGCLWLFFFVFSDGGQPFIDVICSRLLLLLYTCVYCVLLLLFLMCGSVVRTYWPSLVDLFKLIHFCDVDILHFFLVLMQFPDPIPGVRAVIQQYRYSSVRVLVYWSMWFLIVSAEVTHVILMIRGKYT